MRKKDEHDDAGRRYLGEYAQICWKKSVVVLEKWGCAVKRVCTSFTTFTVIPGLITIDMLIFYGN